MGAAEQPLLIFDGACGTSLQALALPPSAWEGRDGCNEWLSVSAPDAIVEVHRQFLDAGATVVETNTFGATAVVLAEYGLEDRAAEINRAAARCARQAVDGRDGCYVAGSLGPTTRLPALGQIGVEDLAAAYRTQVGGLIEGGVDLLIVETCQDLLQLRTALIACYDVMAATGVSLPVMASVTVETTGTLLVGSTLEAVAATVEPFPLLSLGLNCATGPERMVSHVAALSRSWPGRISVIPNAGIPEVVDGGTHYPLTPERFAEVLAGFVADHGVSIVGGCCGTTPAHIRALTDALAGVSPAAREPRWTPSVASLYEAMPLRQDIPPLIIGERMNTNGSKAFRERLLADDYDGCVAVGQLQQERGAHLLDLCTAYAGRDETADLLQMVGRLGESIRCPLVLDSTRPEALEATLARLPGRAVINSINLEDGGETLDRVCVIARRHGAAVIALAIGPEGMARTVEDKLAVAREIHRRAVEQHGLRPSDLLFDMLTFTVGSGEPTLRDAAVQTLEGIRALKAELPDVGTVLGVSNVSFGLPPAARRSLNSVFLHGAVEAGLDAAIVDAGRVTPLHQIPDEVRELCLDLIHDRTDDGGAALEALIGHFAADGGRPRDGDEDGAPAELVERQLERHVLRGEREGVEDLLTILMQRRPALQIIDELLIPAMRTVGELFGRGEILLPFVLKSAEVMKAAVAFLEPHLDGAADQGRRKVLLATVQGDVHDIGKNLVAILLANNGYDVVDLGINVPAERIIDEALERGVDAVGLSGLLVKSAIRMQESMPLFRGAGLDVPLLLGGAALTPAFVGESCAPGYDRPVVYCKDAFAGLRAMQQLEEGTLVSTEAPARRRRRAAPPGPRDAELRRDHTVPAPPFLGVRHGEVEAEVLWPYLNREALFRGRWGYRRSKQQSKEEYQALVAETVSPTLEALRRRCAEEGLLAPRVAYGFWRARADGDAVLVADGGEEVRFDFPRQAVPPHRCIADYVRTAGEGEDVVGFLLVTLGDGIVQAARDLYEADRYHDYLMLHGLAVEVTDALAEHVHERMRRELGIEAGPVGDPAAYAAQGYRGSRYGFGYPACPDLGAQRPVMALLRGDEIGVTLTEDCQMVPEVSTSAIVIHHPQARYFAV